MLKHVIQKKKPVVHLSDIRNLHHRSTYPQYPIATVPQHPSKTFTQQELDDCVAALEFSAGDYITYKAMRTINDLQSIYYCKEIVTDLENIPSWSPSKFPEICLVIPAHNGYNNIPRRWTHISGWGMVKLDTNQFTKLIDDQVLNRIKADIAARDQPPADEHVTC